jgi:hypothetical protein
MNHATLFRSVPPEIGTTSYPPGEKCCYNWESRALAFLGARSARHRNPLTGRASKL